jgi:hypothetical protein
MPQKTTRRRRPAGGPKASAGFPAQLREVILTRRLSAHAVAAAAGVAPSMISRSRESIKIERETAPKPDAAGLDALHFLARNDTPPDLGPATDGTPDGDEMPEITGFDASDATPVTADAVAEDVKGPDGDAAEGALDAIGDAVDNQAAAIDHHRMDDDGAPAVTGTPPKDEGLSAWVGVLD